MGNSNKKISQNPSLSNPIKTKLSVKYGELTKLEREEQQINKNNSNQSNELNEKLAIIRSKQIDIHNEIIALQRSDINSTINTALNENNINDTILILKKCQVRLEKKQNVIDKKINNTSNNSNSSNIDENTIQHQLKMKQCLENEREMILESILEIQTKIMEKEDDLLHEETMRAMKASEIVLAESMKDVLNENEIKIDFENANNKINENYNKQVDNIGKDMKNVLNEYDEKQEALMSEINDLTQQINELNPQIKEMRISETLLLQRYKMYKFAAKNMKDNEDKTNAIQYLRQSKVIKKQIESIRNGKVVLKIDVPPMLDDKLWKK